MESFTFSKNVNIADIENLKTTWRASLTAPQDGMWEALRDAAIHWAIKNKDQIIGYCCVNGENWLLQFFVLPQWLSQGVQILEQFIEQEKIEKGLIGTNNPHCLSLAMHLQKQVNIHTYLFADFLSNALPEKEGKLHQVSIEAIEETVEFYHSNMDAPKEWLNSYLGDLIKKGSVFLFKNKGEILGACEVRKSATYSNIADIGMVIAVEHRRNGYGTFMLGMAKKIAKEWDKEAICSCEKENIGSLKSIQNSGFRSIHQLLLMTF